MNLLEEMTPRFQHGASHAFQSHPPLKLGILTILALPLYPDLHSTGVVEQIVNATAYRVEVKLGPTDTHPLGGGSYNQIRLDMRAG